MMQRALEAGDALGVLRGQPKLEVPHSLRGQVQGTAHAELPQAVSLCAGAGSG